VSCHLATLGRDLSKVVLCRRPHGCPKSFDRCTYISFLKGKGASLEEGMSNVNLDDDGERGEKGKGSADDFHHMEEEEERNTFQVLKCVFYKFTL